MATSSSGSTSANVPLHAPNFSGLETCLLHDGTIMSESPTIPVFISNVSPSVQGKSDDSVQRSDFSLEPRMPTEARQFSLRPKMPNLARQSSNTMKYTLPLPKMPPQCRPLSEATALELCCGSANWTAALRILGIEAVRVDFSRNPQKPKAPTIKADISTAAGQRLVDEADERMATSVLHAAPPCGTASKAREKRIPLRMRNKGAPEPRPLRSSEHPYGLPDLQGTELLRVQLANCIYDYVLDKCIFRASAGLFFSLENPSTSYFWQLPKAIKLMAMAGVKTVDFQQCCHGGKRPVWRRWVTNIPDMETMEAICPGESADHVHEPFAITRDKGAWTFDTASEATYPPKMCKRMASIISAALQTKGFSSSPASIEDIGAEPLLKRQRTRTSAGLFVRGSKFPPIISEFGATATVEVPHGTAPGTALDVPQGKCRVLKIHGGTTGSPCTATVQFWRTPEVFLEAARTIVHPIDLPSFLPEGLLRNIFQILTSSPVAVGKARLEKIRQMRKWAEELRHENESLLSPLPEEQKRVLKGKHLSLLRKTLNHIGYPDDRLVDDLLKGTSLTGPVPTSGVFPAKYRFANINEDQLMKSSPVTRPAVIESIRSSGDPEIDKTVWEVTTEEHEAGWLSEEMTLDQLHDILGNEFVLAKRFGIRQGDKIRAIDDYSICDANDTVSTFEKIDLLGTDEFFVILKTIATAVSDDGAVIIDLPNGESLKGKLQPGTSPRQAREWLGKTFDLKSAYRQIGTSRGEVNKRVAIIGVFNPATSKPAYFLQFATPFGSISSVYLFNRAARALWAIGVWIGLVWGNYFDDYPITDHTSTSQSADLSARAMFALTGFDIAKEVKKNKPFSPSFKFLGIIADLSSLPIGTVTFTNKPERVEDIVKTIDSITKSGRCPPPLMAELRGKTQYAATQIAGRLTVGPSHTLSEHQYRSKSGIVNGHTLEALREVRDVFLNAPPRSLQCLGERRPILVFTDGACEGADRNEVTIGAVVIDTAGIIAPTMWGGPVQPQLVHHWKKDGKVQVIGQAELLPTIMVRRSLSGLCAHRRVIFFVDNDSARHALIKGYSPSKSSNDIVKLMVLAERTEQMWTWYARVPTHSNPADDPSRLSFVPGPANAFAKRVQMPEVPNELFG